MAILSVHGSPDLVAKAKEAVPPSSGWEVREGGDLGRSGALTGAHLATAVADLPEHALKDRYPCIVLDPEGAGPEVLVCPAGDLLRASGLGRLLSMVGAAGAGASERMLVRLKEYVSVVHHDLAEPARNMAFFANVLARDKKLPQDKRDDFMERIEIAGERLQALLRDITEYARVIMGGHAPDVLAAEQVEQIAQEAWTAATGRHGEPDVSLSVSVAGPLTLPTKHLSRMLTELFTNAIEHGPETGGVVNLHVSPDDDGRVELRVGDEGPGIHAPADGRLFRPFYRGRRDDELRTGIGLAMVRALAEAAGGDVLVRPRPGAATVDVVVRFPAAS